MNYLAAPNSGIFGSRGQATGYQTDGGGLKAIYQSYTFQRID
jgi:hypothetical protein